VESVDELRPELLADLAGAVIAGHGPTLSLLSIARVPAISCITCFAASIEALIWMDADLSRPILGSEGTAEQCGNTPVVSDAWAT
jgi:hypothetical protein